MRSPNGEVDGQKRGGFGGRRNRMEGPSEEGEWMSCCGKDKSLGNGAGRATLVKALWDTERINCIWKCVCPWKSETFEVLNCTYLIYVNFVF